MAKKNRKQSRRRKEQKISEGFLLLCCGFVFYYKWNKMIFSVVETGRKKVIVLHLTYLQL